PPAAPAFPASTSGTSPFGSRVKDRKSKGGNLRRRRASESGRQKEISRRDAEPRRTTCFLHGSASLRKTFCYQASVRYGVRLNSTGTTTLTHTGEPFSTGGEKRMARVTRSEASSNSGTPLLPVTVARCGTPVGSIT